MNHQLYNKQILILYTSDLIKLNIEIPNIQRITNISKINAGILAKKEPAAIYP